MISGCEEKLNLVAKIIPRFLKLEISSTLELEI